MNHKLILKQTASIALLLGCGDLPLHAAPQPTSATARIKDDIRWFEKNATLIFEDSFNRVEDGNGAKAIGNGWNSATADRAPHIKQSKIEDGVLKVTTAAEAGHGAHIHHDAGFEDGAAWVRFKLPGLSKSELLTVGFVDREMQGVRAGHLCYAFISSPPGHVTLMDKKTGVSNEEIAKRRDPYLASREKLPPDLEALLASKVKELEWKGDKEWHEVLLVTEGDEMRITIDGRLLGAHRSEGFAHPNKRWFSLGINSTAWVDEVKVWKVK